MQILRIFFSKQGEAAYISHLDLQRVMARALRKSKLPVWYSQGFNPHIYMTFSLPLPLMQDSVVETMDCKTESEEMDFSSFIPALNSALPKGIEVSAICIPKYAAGDIGSAQYEVTYPFTADVVKEGLDTYNSKESAFVVRKTKRTQQEVDLKVVASKLTITQNSPSFIVTLPAGSKLNYNPELLTGYLGQACGLPADKANILRRKVFTVDGSTFE